MVLLSDSYSFGFGFVFVVLQIFTNLAFHFFWMFGWLSYVRMNMYVGKYEVHSNNLSLTLVELLLIR